MRLHRVVPFLLPAVLGAQGVRSAAVHGTVLAQDGTPVAHAVVRLTNTSNGQHWERSTGAAGRYLFEDVTAGGPYRLDVRALAYNLQVSDGILLPLGMRTRADFVLRSLATQLPVVVTVGTRETRSVAGRDGAVDVISPTAIANLPNVGRDFVRLTSSSPFAAGSPSSGGAPTGGVAIAGQ